jgi:riboflavin synthase
VFTGLIEEIGEVIRVEERPEGRRIRIRAPRSAQDLRPGDSISINGVCQTVTALPEPGAIETVAVGETLRRTTFPGLRSGSQVNLERPLRVGDRLGGHWVNGHVDSVATILERSRSARDVAVRIDLPPRLSPYVVEKGSIAVDGVSLTVGRVEGASFTVHLIPETLSRTLFGSYRPGDRVNLEADILAKYVERALNRSAAGAEATPSREQDGAAWGSKPAGRILEAWHEENGDDTSG